MRATHLTSTYRVQLHARFTLRDALGIVDYLERLGISHFYCSPVLAARKGSGHGYDVIDPARVNPELGTEDDWRRLADSLHERGMGLLLDIVPNHMAASSENPYWDDVLAHGHDSPYARWFDIDWPSSGRARVVLPVLGDTLDAVLERGELTLRGDRDHPRVQYFDNSFPVDPRTTSDDVALAALLERQHYRLTHWKNPGNYRRFFDVNDLVALRQEDDRVFDATHELVLRWVGEGVVDGLRIDHIDGLANPRAYLERLRDRGVSFVVVEKILSYGERLPDAWPVAGTTGYEFLNDLDDLFLDAGGMERVEAFYRRIRKLPARTFSDVAYEAKLRAMATSLRGDVQRLARRFRRVAASRGTAVSQAMARAAITHWVASLPVYRTYLVPGEPPSNDDRVLIVGAASEAARRLESVASGAELLSQTLLAAGDVRNTEWSVFVTRLQQLSGAAAAKGIEDSAFYQYVPLISRNEVGGSPDRPLRDAAQRFHDRCVERVARWPLGLVCTTTHDTKRSADARSRLATLTELPTEWERAVTRWRRLNRRHRATVKGRLVPDTNTEYLLYQSLVSIWPGPRPERRLDDLPDAMTLAAIARRLEQYALKAAREAKVHTSWREPNAAYEKALREFVRRLFERPDDKPFLGDVARVVALTAPLTRSNILARVVVHLMAPGTPDLYQGDEFRDLELVDPDNRHAVNFAFLAHALSEIEGGVHTGDAREKLSAIHRLLCFRRRHVRLFERGSYRPLVFEGPAGSNVIGFARALDGHTAVIVAARASGLWEDTALVLPPEAADQRLADVVSGSTIATDGNRVALSSVFMHLPAAVLSSSYLAGSAEG